MIFSVNGTESTRYLYLKKVNLDHFLIPDMKINSRSTVDINNER